MKPSSLPNYLARSRSEQQERIFLPQDPVHITHNKQMLPALRELRYLKCLLLSCTSVAETTHVVCSASSFFLPLLLSDPIDTTTVWAFDVSTFEFGGYL